MSESVKIAIVIREGIVVDVITAGVPVEFATVDYDTGGDAAGAVLVPQDPGIAPELAFVESGTARADGPFVLNCFTLAEGMPVFAVRLKAEGIQVTATGNIQAERRALDDARQFIRDWAYSVEQVEVASGEPDDADDLSFSLECKHEGPQRGEGLWTYTVYLDLIVAAARAEEAPAAMLALLEIPAGNVSGQPADPPAPAIEPMDTEGFRMFEVSGYPSLDVKVLAADEEAAKRAWSAVLKGAGEEGLGDMAGDDWCVEFAFFTDPGDQMPALYTETRTNELHVEPAYDPDDVVAANEDPAAVIAANRPADRRLTDCQKGE